MPRQKTWLTVIVAFFVGLSLVLDQTDAQFRRPGGAGGGFRGFGGGFGRRGMLNMLTEESIQNHLELSSDQRDKVQELVAKSREPNPEVQKLYVGMRDATDEEREARSPHWIAPIVTWLCSPESAGVTGRVFEASGQVLAVAEGWVRGPTTDPVDDPTKIGPIVERLLADARPNSGMSGEPGAWPQTMLQN